MPAQQVERSDEGSGRCIEVTRDHVWGVDNRQHVEEELHLAEADGLAAMVEVRSDDDQRPDRVAISTSAAECASPWASSRTSRLVAT